MTDDQMRGLFKEMRDEPVPADSLARVQLKVDERVSPSPRRSMWWWRLAAAALVVVFTLGLLWKTPQAPLIATKPPNPVETAKVERPAVADPPVVRPARPRRVEPAAQPTPPGAVAIRIETPDPDVVIILLGDEGPGF
jgi:hypothetical protein